MFDFPCLFLQMQINQASHFQPYLSTAQALMQCATDQNTAFSAPFHILRYFSRSHEAALSHCSTGQVPPCPAPRRHLLNPLNHLSAFLPIPLHGPDYPVQSL